MTAFKRVFVRRAGALACALALTGCAGMTADPSLADVLATRPELSTLNRLVIQAGLQDSLRGEAPLTLLAPNDEAFKALPQRTLDALAADPAQLKAVLNHHLVEGRLATGAMPAKLRTRSGADIVTSRAGDFVTLEEALIVQADVPARNGNLDVIDRVLIPPVKK
ncbi:MAG: hypothetical protein RLZZ592_1635 [Pseudomonadota bacterium]|nr:hypothetical protein [Pseudomonadota bacterium]